MIIPPEFSLLLATYQKRADRARFIQEDTAEVLALYEDAREQMGHEMLRLEMAAALHAKIKMAQVRLKQIMLVAESAADKAGLLHEAKNIEQTVLLADAMIEVLENYDSPA